MKQALSLESEVHQLNTMETNDSASKSPNIMTEPTDNSTQSMANLVKVKQEPGIKLEPTFVDFTHPLVSLNEIFQPKIEKIEPDDNDGNTDVEEPCDLFDPIDQFEDLNPVNSTESPEAVPISTIEQNSNHADDVSHMENSPTGANVTTTNQFEADCSYSHGERMVPASELNEMATEANVEMPSTNTGTNKKRLTSTSKAKQHKCTVCGYVTSRANNLQRHMRMHTGEKPFACESCPKRFTQQSNLQRHMKIHVTEDSCKCSICWQIFPTRSDLLGHKLRCKRRYECHLCKAYSTSQIADLKVHMRVHSGVRPFQCAQCLTKFTNGSNLNKHMKKIHANPRARPLQYRCSVCARNFVKHSERDEHQMNCKRRRWECYVCQSYATHMKLSLQFHMRMKHTGERPFKCALCDMCYATSSNLSLHKKRIHKQRSL